MLFRRDVRHERAVLDALAMVGDAGMTAIGLAMSLGEPEAHVGATLDRLTGAGLVGHSVESADHLAMRRTRYFLS